MSGDRRIRETATGLRADKVTERRRAAEVLKTTLQGDGIVKNLNTSTWEYLFNEVHDYVLKELEKLDSSRSSSNNNVIALCTSLLHNTVVNANKYECYIDHNKLLDCCFEILRNRRFTSVMGSAYLTVIIKHILPVSHYLQYITPHQWADLLDIAIEQCNHDAIDSLTTSQHLIMVLRQGIFRCHLVLPIRDNLTSLENLFVSKNTEKKQHLQENFLEIAVLIIENIGAESRLAFCKFTEAILPHALKFYEQTSIAYKNKKKLLFKFFRLCIILHHPKGRISDMPGCLANDWNSWNNSLTSIHQLMVAESFLINQHQEKNLNSQFLSIDEDLYMEYIKFAVEICHQVFKGEMNVHSKDDIDSDNHSKRRKLEFHNFFTFSQVLENLPKTFHPWIRILNEYVKQYGHVLCNGDKLKFFDLIFTLSTSEEKSYQHPDLYDCILSIYDKIDVLDWNEKYNELSISIWNLALRKTSTQNDVFVCCHKILQFLLVFENFQPPLNGLIKSYYDKNMSYSDISIDTLSILLEKYNMKINNENMRLQIAKWTLDNYVSLKHRNNISMVLFQLCIKENVSKNTDKVVISNDETVFINLFDDMESFLLISDFEEILYNKDDMIEDKKSSPTSYSFILSIYNFILETILSNLSKYISITKETKVFSLEILIDLDILLRFVSFAFRYEIDEYNNTFKNIKIKMLEAFNIVNTYFPSHLNSIPNGSNKKLEFLENFKNLYVSDHYTEDISNFIREKTYKEIIEFLISLTNGEKQAESDVFDMMEDDSDKLTSVDNRIKSQSIDIICNYCCKKSRYRSVSLDEILQEKFYNLKDKSDFDIAFNVISFILEKFKEDIPISDIISLMKAMCKSSYRDNEAAFKILTLLFRVLEPVRNCDNSNMKNNCIIMLESFLSRCNSHYYSVRTMGQALKCLSWILSRSKCDNWGKKLDDVFMETLRSNIFSIRLYSCYCLHLYIANSEPRKFPKLVDVLPDIFKLDDTSDLTTFAISDEGANRTSTILHCLTLITLSSSVWNEKALASILKISLKKNINIKLIKKVIYVINQLINKEENYISTNMLYLINFWFNHNLPIENFPWSLTKCDSIEDFYFTFRHIIISQELFCVQNIIDRKVVQILTQGLSSNQIILECVPDLIIICLSTISYEEFDDNTNLKEVLDKKFKTNLSEINDNLFSEAIIANIEKILYGLLIHVYDDQDIKDFFEWDGYLPQINPPIITPETFLLAVKYLDKCLPISIMQKIYKDDPAILQKLLLEIWASIDSYHTVEMRLLSLYRYWIFCRFLKLESDLNTFICHFVVKSLLTFIDKYKNTPKFRHVSIAACKILLDLLKNMLPRLSDTVSSLIPSIILTITRFENEDFTLGKDGLKILQLLCVNMREHFKDVFATLDPLPSTKFFQNINENISNDKFDLLESQIENFLAGHTVGRSAGLELLYQKLVDNRQELGDMFNNLNKIRGLSEDCSKSNLHILTSVLIKISSNLDDTESALLASKCLGEIGSCNFHTLVLQMPNDRTDIISDPQKCFAYTVFKEINGMIFDSNPNVIRAATKALTSFLSFNDGREILGSFKDNTMKEIMLPFITNKKMSNSLYQILSQTFNTYLDRAEIWYDFNYKDHVEWIIDLVVSGLNCFSNQQCFVLNLIDIFQLKYSLAEKCFPSLIGLLLYIGNGQQVQTIHHYIQCYFDRYYDLTFKSDEYNETLKTNEKCSKINKNFSVTSVKCMLQLVQFIRLQMKYYKWKKPLSFNYLPVAWAAYSTGSYFMAILYGELWCNELMDNVPPINPAAILSYDHSQDMLTIMRKSYQKIGDADAVQGCGSGHLSNLSERRQHYVATGNFSDAFLMHDLLLSTKKIPSGLILNENFQSDVESVSVVRSFAQCLHSSGLFHLSDKYMQSFQDNTQFDDIKFDCFWRLGDWSLHVDTSLLNSKSSSNVESWSTDYNGLWSAHQYGCLKNALSRNVEINDSTLLNSLKRARNYLINNCEQYAIEGCQFVYQLMGKLQSLQDIEDFGNNPIENRHNLISRWSVKNMLPFNTFKNIEPIVSQRLLILENILTNSTDNLTKLSIMKLQLEYAELALENDSIQTCNRWINRVTQVIINSRQTNEIDTNDLSRIAGLVRLTEGKAAWKSGHKDVALHLVKKLITEKTYKDDNLYAHSLMQYGSWMLETRSESALDISNNYLMESLIVLGTDGNLSSRLSGYLTIARFADGEYKQIHSYINSSAFINKIKCMEKCKDTAQSLKLKQDDNLSRNERKAMLFNDRQGKIDESEIVNMQAEREQYLELALRYYVLSLREGDDNDLLAFRVISLWLDNSLMENFNMENEKTFVEYFNLIPSWKFLTLIPQLAPRLNYTKGNSFQEAIYKLIKKCAIEHPHHTLPILLALKNSNKDADFKSESTSKSQTKETEEYVTTTKRILESVSLSDDSTIKECINEMETLSIGLISFANFHSKSKVALQKIPRSEPIKSLKNLKHALVPTMNLPISKTGNYRNITSVLSFSDDFMLVGGINAPKKLACRGSDGIHRNMLLKGEDDIRQDAVMQQVFGIVNNLLASDRHTKEKRLIIRTYKVVPLSRHSGIIEWCDGTEPFGKLLVGADGSSGYHAKLRPNDIPARSARELMISKQKATNEDKLKAFKNILAKFKPVFHHFFTINFLTPALWYERRVAYMHSVATSSMTGYILGLGDRHVQNILIDLSTAEVVHIDFGVAFEQGRLQPTPETVPFRLTQDMVAGFGCTGVEGVFKRSCEKTMDVLKSNQEILLTILEVLLCDPLYIWTVNEEQNNKNQNSITSSLMTLSTSRTSSNEGSGSEAERALLRIRNKLDGIEFGSILATSGQVARLIQQAMDIKNLSRLFHGWQPYL
ncbi:serine/threonine-protein kinase tefu [Arctopsyche grandis]|uniref:serine/threonine-protein kinase tefu n=1 Tax=Arctopsyche grandis TaxID=121162 RepID=UPI00406D91D2